MNSLFPYRYKQQLGILPALIRTPFGLLGLQWSVDATSTPQQAHQVHQLTTDGNILVWQEDHLRIELLIDRLPSSLYDDTMLEDAWMAVWRVQAEMMLQHLQLVCYWQTPYMWKQNILETGQGLFAQTWYNQTYYLSVGTEDEEGIAFRTHRQRDPKNTHPFSYDVMQKDKKHRITYSEMDIGIHCHELNQQQIYQFHYLVAWTKEHNDTQSQAVDWASDRLLAAYEQAHSSSFCL